MNQLEALEQEIYNSGINVYQNSMTHFRAMSVVTDNEKSIIIDDNQLKSSCEKRTELMHEYYHCKYDQFYNFDTRLQTRRYRETRVHRRMIKDILPPELLRSLLESGKKDFEIADELCITEQIVKDAKRLYDNIGWN